jgi:hypothetical protein
MVTEPYPKETSEPGATIGKPTFGEAGFSHRSSGCFCFDAVSEGPNASFTSHISQLVKSIGLTVRRADDFFTAHQIMKDVWTAICRTRIVIADCTGRNPNVFYEIGMAHTVGKPVILITQNEADVPFDLRHIRFIEYKYTPPGMEQFERSLESTIRTVLGSNDSQTATT